MAAHQFLPVLPALPHFPGHPALQARQPAIVNNVTIAELAELSLLHLNSIQPVEVFGVGDFDYLNVVVRMTTSGPTLTAGRNCLTLEATEAWSRIEAVHKEPSLSPALFHQETEHNQVFGCTFDGLAGWSPGRASTDWQSAKEAKQACHLHYILINFLAG